jgi:hypothetical protein
MREKKWASLNLKQFGLIAAAIKREMIIIFRPLKFRIYDADKSHRCRFFEFFPPFFCTTYTGTKCEEQAKIHFFLFLYCSFEFSVFLVSVLYVKKCLEIVEICFQGNLFSTYTDTKKIQKIQKNNTRTIKVNFSLFFAFSTGISRAEWRRKKFKKTTSVWFIRVINAKFKGSK